MCRKPYLTLIITLKFFYFVCCWIYSREVLTDQCTFQSWLWERALLLHVYGTSPPSHNHTHTHTCVCNAIVVFCSIPLSRSPTTPVHVVRDNMKRVFYTSACLITTARKKKCWTRAGVWPRTARCSLARPTNGQNCRCRPLTNGWCCTCGRRPTTCTRPCTSYPRRPRGWWTL